MVSFTPQVFHELSLKVLRRKITDKVQAYAISCENSEPIFVYLVLRLVM